jgi:DNA-binding PadR family transcriptional regulator
MHPTPNKVEAMTFTITDKGREVLKQWQSQQQSNPNGPTPPTSAGTSSSSTPSG